MPQPQSLPEDILHLIIQHILDDNDDSTAPPHFYEVADSSKNATESQKCSQRTRTLRSLMLTSRHLYALVKPLFYRDIVVPQWHANKQRHITWMFYETISRNPELTAYFHRAVINTSNFKGYDQSIPVFAGRYQLAVYESLDERGSTPVELSALLGNLFFWSPNLRALTIVEINAWDALPEGGAENPLWLPGTSPLTHLTLTHCGAKEAALTSLLAWPHALKTLHYDADQGAWAMHYHEDTDEDSEEGEWTCAAFVRALRTQKGTLTELLLTRKTPECERMYMGPRIDLSEFSSLRVLKIFEVFLTGVEPEEHAWRGLPPSIELLEVFYDDASYQGIRLFEGYPEDRFSEEDQAYGEYEDEDEDREHRAEVEVEEWWDGLWLSRLLVERVMGGFPELKTVRVYTTEGEPGSWFNQNHERKRRLWKLPQCVKDSARQADVKVEVWLSARDY
ncbi:hypothetical protein BJX65DRAFT_313516 [Aspergillus insuetus]